MPKQIVIAALSILLVSAAIVLVSCSSHVQNSFTRLMVRGNGYLEKGDATNAINIYLEAVKLVPENIDVRLNLANAYLLANDSSKVIEQCQQAIAIDHNSAAAYYLMGCACLRLNQAEKAVQSFQQSKQIDPAVTALDFQLGLAEAALATGTPVESWGPTGGW